MVRKTQLRLGGSQDCSVVTISATATGGATESCRESIDFVFENAPVGIGGFVGIPLAAGTSFATGTASFACSEPTGFEPRCLLVASKKVIPLGEVGISKNLSQSVGTMQSPIFGVSNQNAIAKLTKIYLKQTKSQNLIPAHRVSSTG
jgi:hypothetical protein